MDPSYARVTASGQVSLPAAIRRRWGAGSVVVIDRGEYVIVRPVPADPISELLGSHRGDGPSSDAARATERADDDDRSGGNVPPPSASG